MIRALVLALAAGAVASVSGHPRLPEEPGRSAYGMVTAGTTITVSDDVVTDIMDADHRIEISGDGMLRDTKSGSRRETSVALGHVSQAELVRLLNELAALDFLNMKCTEPYEFQVDHGPHPWVRLAVPAGTRRVELDDCGNHHAELEAIVDDLYAIAKRATAE
jgi:hypothetical protein